MSLRRARRVWWTGVEAPPALHRRLRLILAAAAILVLLAAALSARWWWRRHAEPVARAGERLVLIGPFVNYAGGQQGYNVAGRVQAALEREVLAGRLDGVRVAVWPQEIRDGDAALAAVGRSRAAMVIWGEYDSGRVLAHFTVPGSSASVAEPAIEQLIGSPSDLSPNH